MNIRTNLAMSRSELRNEVDRTLAYTKLRKMRGVVQHADGVLEIPGRYYRCKCGNRSLIREALTQMPPCPGCGRTDREVV